MKSIIILTALVMFGYFNSKAETKTDSVVITIEVEPSKMMRLRYLDDALKEHTIEFKNTEERSKKVKKVIKVNKPTEFKYNLVLQDGASFKSFFHNFLAYKGDSICMEFVDFDLKVLRKSKNILFIDSLGDYLELSKSLSISNTKQNEYSQYFDKIESGYLANEKALVQRCPAQALKDYGIYNEIDYYNRLLVPFSSQGKELGMHRQFIVDKIKALESKNADFNEINSYQRKWMYLCLVKVKGLLEAKDMSSITNYLDILAQMQLPEDIFFQAYIEKLDAHPNKTESTFVKAVDRLKELSINKTYNIEVTKFANYIAPVLLNQDKIMLENPASNKMSFNDLLKTNKGNIIVIDFWASWCVPCRNESPLFQTFKKKFKDEKIKLISISIDEDSKVKDWSKALKEDNLLIYPDQFRLINPKESNLIKLLKINSIPRLILIDKKGEIINSNFYRPSDKEFEPAIRSYL